MLCRSQFNRDQAEKILNKASEIDYKRTQAYVDYRNHNKIQADTLRIEEGFKKAIELNPEKAWMYIDFAWFYANQNKLTQAQELLEKAVALNPESDKLFASLANICRQAGKPELMQKYYDEAKELRLNYYNPITAANYLRLKEILDARGIKLICVQYPMLNIEPLKRIFQGESGVIFVDNEQVFKEGVEKTGYNDYFSDMFGSDFGHCTQKGNRLLAENIAKVILKEVSSR